MYYWCDIFKIEKWRKFEVTDFQFAICEIYLSKIFEMTHYLQGHFLFNFFGGKVNLSLRNKELTYFFKILLTIFLPSKRLSVFP